MFFFVNFEGNIQSTSQDKGKLFEGLVGELVDALGYRVTEIRAKTAGKEYDVLAKEKLGGRPLIGQAKAWDKGISSKEIAEFVGSLDLEDFPEDALGLFVSLTDLTPDGKDYLRRLRPPKRGRINTIVAEQILERLHQIGYEAIDNVKQRAEQIFQNKPGDTYLLVSNRGNYFVQLLVRQDETRPKAFCVLDKNGLIISETDFGTQLKQRLEELRELNFLTQPSGFTSVLDAAPGPVGPGPEGTSWFEYKLPAPPQFFIGREPQIEHFQSFLNDVKENRTGIRVYQVLSPSGVGKSSFILKIQSLLDQPACSVIEDARNFRSSVDLLALLQGFLENCRRTLGVPVTVPTDTASVLNQFSAIDHELQQHDIIGIIFVDQFESLFLKPDLYAQFLDFVIRINHDAKRVIFCITRRNDQPTTFDDRVDLDLSRLIGMSRSVELKDFSRIEALALLSHLSDEISQKAWQRLVNLALEFAASGFPWLCKRVGAHIRDAVVKKGLTQEELIQNGIRLEELFEEDLAGLDIIDKEFLKDLAKYLPATIEDLSQKFDGKQLAAKLRVFQDLRLVRLIGRTYDTYNDVFKEYLKTGQIPLPAKYVYRSAPSTAKEVLDTIVEHNCQSVKLLSKQVSTVKQATLQNVLRELRMLGLIETSRGHLTIDKEAMDAFYKDTLDSLLRDRVWRRNGLVRDVLNRMATQDRITLDQLTEYLKEGLPVLEIAERSWQVYARTFTSWLLFYNLVRQGQIVGERNRPIGVTRPTSPKVEGFLPSIYISELIQVIEHFQQSNTVSRIEIIGRKHHDRVKDCVKVGLLQLDETDTLLEVTPLGRVFISDIVARPKIIRDFLLTLPHVLDYLRQVETSRKKHLDVFKLVIGNVGYAEETWIWRSKVFAEWLEFAGLVIRKHGQVQKSQQSSLFD